MDGASLVLCRGKDLFYGIWHAAEAVGDEEDRILQPSFLERFQQRLPSFKTFRLAEDKAEYSSVACLCDAQSDKNPFLFHGFHAGNGPFHRNIGGIEVDDGTVLYRLLVELQRVSDCGPDNLSDLLPGDSDSRDGGDGIDNLALRHSAKIEVKDLRPDVSDVMAVLCQKFCLEVFVSCPRNLKVEVSEEGSHLPGIITVS